MGKRFALWLVVGGIVGALAMGGCQKKEEPAPAATSAPAAGAPAGAGAVTSAPAGETSPAAPAPTGETKTAEKKEEGKKK